MANTLPTTGDLLRSGFASTPEVTGSRRIRRVLLLAGFLVVFLPLQLFHRLCLALDRLLFPGFQKLDIEQPLFIIGPPRSGTTYLHRMVAADPQFTTFYLWELLLAPAICQKQFWLAIDRIDAVFGHPARKALIAIERLAFSGMNHIHPTSLMDAEEDYFGLLPIYACFLLVVPFPDCRKVWDLSRFDDSQSPESRQRVMTFYRGLLQRHLYVRGVDRRIVSKNPSFCGLLLSLHQCFPSARFAIPIRTPVETLPSLLSSMEGGAVSLGYSPETLAPEFLATMQFYYRHISESLGKLGDQSMVVPYQDLVSHPNDSLVKLYRALGYEHPSDSSKPVESRSKSSGRYRSRHNYSLEQFGLSESAILSDYQWLFEDPRMGLSRPASDPSEPSSPTVEPSLSGVKSWC